jgi:hypothetical protein
MFRMLSVCVFIKNAEIARLEVEVTEWSRRSKS